MRWLTSEELRTLTDSEHSEPCANPCTNFSQDWGEEGDEHDLDVCLPLVARGLMYRFECENSVHYRNTPMGNLLASLAPSLSQ